MRFQVFVDPIYGSERYIEIAPSWVIDVEDRQYKLKLLSKLFLKRKEHPITYVKLRNNREYLIDGHWAERIKAARGDEPEDEKDTSEEVAPEETSEAAEVKTESE